jgi:hypothetical protein
MDWRSLCPESGDVVAERLADNDGLLLHLLMSDPLCA